MSLGNYFFFQFCYFKVTVMTQYQKLLNLKILELGTMNKKI